MVTFSNPNLRLKNFKSAGRTGSWYEIKNVSNEMTDLFIYDEIGSFGVEANTFIRDLENTTSKVLNIRISSPGGDVFQGLNILNALRNHPSRKVVTIDGIAASAASFIAMAGDTIRMSPQAVMMVHDAQSSVGGNASDLREVADLLDKMSNNIANIYASRTGKSSDEWRKIMLAETWFTDQEAVEAGLADEIVANAKIKVSNKITNSAPDGDIDLGDGWVKGADGKVRFDPDGDGDDDSTPEGDTDHDYFDEEGNPIKPIPPKPGENKTEVKNDKAEVDTSEWNADKAWSNGAASDNPEAFYRAICAGEKTTGDPATQAHWALPYRYTPDSPPNAAAVRNALARLSQTHNLKNPEETRAKLETILKKINSNNNSVTNTIDSMLLAVALQDALKGVKND